MNSPRPAKSIRTQSALLPDLLSAVEQAVTGERIPLDRYLRSVFREHREFGSRDRRLFRDVAFAYFRWRGWIEPTAPTWPEAVLASWILDAPDIDPAIEALAREGGEPDLAPLGECPIEEKQRWIGDVLSYDEPPPLDALMPAWWPETLPQLCRERQPAIIAAMQERLPVWLRLRGEDLPDAFEEALQGLASDVIAWPTLPDAIGLPPGVPLQPLEQTFPGVFDIQDLASQAVVQLCGAEPGQRWWDACAGAGGKSIGLADHIGESGSVLSTDSRRPMLRELRRRAHRAGIRILHPLRRDLRRESLPGDSFDGVLLDAPCSGTGTWARHPDGRWRAEPVQIERQATRQREILERVAEAVAPGGTLVYAVCTLTSRETDQVVDLFLARHTDFQLDPVPHPLSGDPTDGRVWILPDEYPANGMFAARFRRRA